MSQLDITPQTPLQFEVEDASTQELSEASPSQASPSQDSVCLCGENEVEGKSVSLAAKAKADEALWDDYISSEDPDFEQDKENEEPESDEEDENTDSEDMAHHDACVELADALRAVLKEKGWKAQGSKKEARAALVGVLEDHFISK
jgi:hypothetical protein